MKEAASMENKLPLDSSKLSCQRRVTFATSDYDCFSENGIDTEATALSRDEPNAEAPPSIAELVCSFEDCSPFRNALMMVSICFRPSIIG